MTSPFSSIIFKKKFISHFIDGKSAFSFDFIDGIEFYKHSLSSLYINIGRNLTKGINYKFLCTKHTNIFSNKTFSIYDVPDYINTEPELLPNGIVLLKVKQYLGYYIDLRSFQTIDSYFKKNFSRSTRYKFRKYRRRLENSFNIRYSTFKGDIDKAIYNDIFDSFFSLLKKRYTQKQIRNNNLDSREWAFYKDVAYEMIRSGQASLFVIYDQDTPISISLNYLDDKSVINAITVFDIDYSIFHVGSVAIWKQLEWCLESNYRIFNFSKGHFEYKAQWATNKYQFEHHIVYNKKSFASTTIAWYLFAYQSTKQFFRKINLNVVYNKIRFRTNHLNFSQNPGEKYITQKMIEILPDKPLTKIDRNDAAHFFIKKPLNSFIYLNQDHVKDIDIFLEVNTNKKIYYFKGKNVIERICYSK